MLESNTDRTVVYDTLWCTDTEVLWTSAPDTEYMNPGIILPKSANVEFLGSSQNVQDIRAENERYQKP